MKAVNIQEEMSKLMTTTSIKEAKVIINNFQDTENSDIQVSLEDYINNLNDLRTNTGIKKLIFKEMFKLSDCSGLREIMDLAIESGSDYITIRYGLDRVIEDCNKYEVLNFEEEIWAYGKKDQKIALNKVKRDEAESVLKDLIVTINTNNTIITNMIGKILNSSNEEIIEESHKDILKYGTPAQIKKLIRDFPKFK